MKRTRCATLPDLTLPALERAGVVSVTGVLAVVVTTAIAWASISLGAAEADDDKPRTRKGRELPIGESPWRSYGKPLTVDDFLGDVPKQQTKAGVTIRAYAYMGIRYEFRAQFTEADEQVTATMTEIELFSSIDRKKSWLDDSTKLPPSLLDHLQGHFDLMEIEARKGRKALAKRLTGDSVIRGKGKDQNAAIVDLQKNIDASMKPFGDRALKAREIYDKTTRNGSLVDKVREERRLHRKYLAKDDK